MKLLMESWKYYIKEAIVDVPSERLSDVFDDNGVMQEKVIAVIKDAKEKLYKFLSSQNLKITDMFVVGAAVTYQFSPSSDIDTTVVIPNITDEQWKQVDNWMEENLNYSNWSVDGSSRPFQFKPASSNTGYKNVDAAYDPFNKKWIKEPNLETTKQEYNQVVSDPQSKERKMYAFVEKHIQPSLQQLFNVLSNTNLNENVSDNIKNAIKSAFKRYEVLKRKRGTAYGEDPSQTGRISQNWGLGNVLYKFLDREGYSEVYGYLKKAIKSDFKIVDQNFINTLKQKLENVLKGEHGYSVNETKENKKMAKLTESYLRGMIKQVMKEAYFDENEDDRKFKAKEAARMAKEQARFDNFKGGSAFDDKYFQEGKPWEEAMMNLESVMADYEMGSMTAEELSQAADELSALISSAPRSRKAELSKLVTDAHNLSLQEPMYESRKPRTAPKRK